MSHALIIDDNMVLGHAIANRLASFGFDSFDRTWAEHQAIEAACMHIPDLIVAGESIAEGSPVEVAREIAASSGAPLLFVSASGPFRLEHCSPEGIEADAPFPVLRLDAVLESACVEHRDLRHYA